ncbi:hypothetical protein C0992_006357 [Termitomyces sp. T32_za158]|nr:hypothetical protein C0992_006357 [Termitomyces sp. T32_za158]
MTIFLKSRHNPSIQEVPDEDCPLLPNPLSPPGPMLEDLKGEGSAKNNTKTQYHAAPKTPNPTPMPPLDAQTQAPTSFFLTDTGTSIIPSSNTNPNLSRLKTDENSDFPPFNINSDLSRLKTNKNPHSPSFNVNSNLSRSKTSKNSDIPPSNTNSDLSRNKTSKNSDIPPSHTNPDCHDLPPGHHPNTPRLLAPTTLFCRRYSALHRTPALSTLKFPETPALTPAISASTLIDPTQLRSPASTLPDLTVPPPASPGDHSGDHFRHPGRHPKTDH